MISINKYVFLSSLIEDAINIFVLNNLAIITHTSFCFVALVTIYILSFIGENMNVKYEERMVFQYSTHIFGEPHAWLLDFLTY